eukprot:TRINITY_DN11321_c0_g1_i1.p1 TRINITY_DN11321_c0_g1~~TRINITY_DN11321_c0_g1_i1.p1  ORF type:complete len:713 (+),score=204.01 TRINITY_DN11321_c0_g1_i1:87-2141(+)
MSSMSAVLRGLLSVTLLLQATAAGLLSPVGKVVQMLEDIQSEVTAEGKQEQEVYDKFMCYCKSNMETLAQNIEAADKKLEPLQSEIESLSTKRSSLQKEVAEYGQDTLDASFGEQTARSLRRQQRDANKASAMELQKNIRILKQAIYSAKNAESLLQEGTAADLRKLVSELDLGELRQRQLLAFCDGREGGSALVVSVLRTLMEKMQKDFHELMEEENEAARSFGGLMVSKMGEGKAMTDELRVKKERLGEMKLQLIQMKLEMDKTEKARVEDRQFLANLQETCKARSQAWPETVALRNEELQALASTIQMLGSGENRALLKTSLGLDELSFLQLPEEDSDRRAAALKGLTDAKEALQSPAHGLEFISLAMQGKKVGVDEVKRMVDGLMTHLKSEQTGDEQQQAYCLRQYKAIEDKKTRLKVKHSETTAAMDELEETIGIMKQDMSQMREGIQWLDSSVAEATQLRKNEFAEFKASQAQTLKAKDLLAEAAELLREGFPEERVSLLAEVSAHLQDTPAEQSQADLGPSTQTSGVQGALRMLDDLVSDVDKRMAQAEATEKRAQADYEKFMQHSTSKRSDDASVLALKGAAKAHVESELWARQDIQTSTERAQSQSYSYKLALDNQCAPLLNKWDERVATRQAELKALQKAKDTLEAKANDDGSLPALSFAQVQSSSLRRARRSL